MVLRIAILLIAFTVIPVRVLAQDEPAQDEPAQFTVPVRVIPVRVLAQDEPAQSETFVRDWVTCLANSLPHDPAFATLSYTIESPSAGVYVASIVNETKTADRHGLLRLKWFQRQVANFQIIEANDQYFLSDIDGYVELRAPWGAWRRENERVPDLHISELVPRLGDPIQAARCSETD